MNWVLAGKPTPISLNTSWAPLLFWEVPSLGLCTLFPMRALQVSCQEPVIFALLCPSSVMQFLCHCNNSPFLLFLGGPQAFMMLTSFIIARSQVFQISVPWDTLQKVRFFGCTFHSSLSLRGSWSFIPDHTKLCWFGGRDTVSETKQVTHHNMAILGFEFALGHKRLLISF